jgi:hypothetical protein
MGEEGPLTVVLCYRGMLGWPCAGCFYEDLADVEGNVLFKCDCEKTDGVFHRSGIVLGFGGTHISLDPDFSSKPN